MTVVTNFRYWVLSSDSSSPIGGVKQLYRLSEALTASGRTSCVVSQTVDFVPAWFDSSASVISYAQWSKIDLDPSRDLIVIPETFVPYKSKYPALKKIVFNQNASYTLGVPPVFFDSSYPSSVLDSYLEDDILHTLCVSTYDYSFLSEFVGIPVDRLSLVTNCIESFFSYPQKMSNTITYMPRKNHHFQREFFSLLSRSSFQNRFVFKSLKGLNQAEVCSAFQDSICFLNFGYPEGFGLPVAEALACGSAVVGFNSLGTKDIYCSVSSLGVFFPCEPFSHLGFFNALISFSDSYFSNRKNLISSLKESSNIISKTFSFDSFVQGVCKCFADIEARI